ncbi:hypothetical protein [Haloarcula sp. JP-L23]|uniref:hypothetical protein n=1 Tax=Haloarcula sp. JP-L23 TaxID=2716717 RepID=UPI00140EBF5E|nr:hypothetical protein G9465_18170 [Haloarcula sp. JP-L23]
MMDQFPSGSRTWLFGRDRTRTRWFITSAVGLCGLTAGFAALGYVLLSEWPRLYAHLVIESIAVFVFVSAVGLAIANAYMNDGVLTSTLLIIAPVMGLFIYLLVRATALGTTMLAPLTLDSILHLGAGIGAICLGSYLLGILLYLQQTPDFY